MRIAFLGLAAVLFAGLLVMGCTSGSTATPSPTGAAPLVPAITGTPAPTVEPTVEGTETPLLLPNPSALSNATTATPTATAAAVNPSCTLTATPASASGDATISFNATFTNVPPTVTQASMTCQAGGTATTGPLSAGKRSRACSYANPTAATVFTAVATAGDATCSASVTISPAAVTATPTATPSATPNPTSMSVTSGTVSATNTTVNVSWSSSLAGTSYLYYGTSASLGSFANNTALLSVTEHEVDLTSLTGGTVYSFIVSTCTNTSTTTAYCSNATLDTFTVKLNSAATLTLNGQSNDLTLQYPASVTYVAASNYGTANLTQNTSRNITLSGTTATETLPPGTYTMEAQTSGDLTHYWSHVVRTLTVQPANVTATLTLNGSAATLTGTAPLTVSVASSCSTGGSLYLYRNGTLLSSGPGGTYSDTLATPTSYNYTAYCTPTDTNHTSAATTYWTYAT